MATPRSVRLDDSVLEALAGFVLRHPGMSASSAISLLVSEGLRSEAHPGITFRDGPAGRRAVVMGGPDVWEIISAVEDARGQSPSLPSPDIIDLVCSSTGASARHVHVALDYYGEHAEEIDEIVSDNRRMADALEASIARRDALLPT